jgi:hypothetical protein
VSLSSILDSKETTQPSLLKASQLAIGKESEEENIAWTYQAPHSLVLYHTY